MTMSMIASQSDNAGEAAEIRGLLRQSLETALGRLYSFEQRPSSA